jgi:anti-sigma regulatory factor (Ser/Thr protein kinase)
MSPVDPPPQRVSLVMPSTVDLVNVARMTILHAVEAAGALTGARLDDLRLATSEAVTNAIQANRSNDPSQPVRIVCEFRTGLVKLQVSDSGGGMPETMSLPPINDPERLHTEGGFGVPLMRALSRDRVEFDTSARGTTVSIWLAQ